jgi:hypothetical protein
MTKVFYLGIFIILTIYTTASYIITISYGFGPIKINSIIWSGVISTINIIAAFLIVRFTFDKNASAFNKIFLSSMTIRFFVLLAAIFIILKFVNVHQFTFLLTLFLLYSIFQFWEVYILNKNLKRG